MKKLKTLLLTSTLLGLTTLAATANANINIIVTDSSNHSNSAQAVNSSASQTTDTTNTSNTSKSTENNATSDNASDNTKVASTTTSEQTATKSTSTDATIEDLKQHYPLLFQVTGFFSLSSNPDVVNYYQNDASTFATGGIIRLGFRTSQKLDYDYPLMSSANYFTVGVTADSYNIDSNKAEFSDWVSGGVSFGDQIEFSNASLPYLHSTFMPGELVISRENFKVYSTKARFIHSNNAGDTYATEYTESRTTFSYYVGLGVRLGPVFMMSKVGYNFTQSAFKFDAEVGFGL